MFHEKIQKCVVFEPINVMLLSRICEEEMLNEITVKSITLDFRFSHIGLSEDHNESVVSVLVTMLFLTLL